MNARIQTLQAFLKNSVPAEIGMEKEIQLLDSLLMAMSQKTIMILGRQDGDPCSLISGLGLGKLLPDHFAAPYPVECRHGKALSLSVFHADGAVDRFYNASDLQRYLSSHEDANITSLVITAPHEALLERNLLFFALSAENAEQTELYAERCQGFSIVVSASAGAPGDEITAFCERFRRSGRPAGSACVVLNHAEETLFVNRSLATAMRALIGEPLEVYTCRHGAIGNSSAEMILPKMLFALEAVGAAPSEQEFLHIRDQAKAKLLQSTAHLNGQIEKEEAEENAWRSAAQTMKNEASINRYNLSNLISEEEKRSLKKEIENYTRYLDEKLPSLAEELLESPKQAKADMANLCCEYLENMLEGFLFALAEDLTEKTLLPRALKVFDDTKDQMKLLMKRLPLDITSEGSKENEADVDFLRAIHLHIGKIDTKLATALGQIVVWLSTIVGFIYQAPLTGNRIGNLLGNLVTKLVTDLTPAPAFIKEFIEELRQKLPPEKQAAMLHQTLNESLLPLIVKEVETLYDGMVEDYTAPFYARTEKLHEQIIVKKEEAARLAELGARLETL